MFHILAAAASTRHARLLRLWRWRAWLQTRSFEHGGAALWTEALLRWKDCGGWMGQTQQSHCHRRTRTAVASRLRRLAQPVAVLVSASSRVLRLTMRTSAAFHRSVRTVGDGKHDCHHYLAVVKQRSRLTRLARAAGTETHVEAMSNGPKVTKRGFSIASCLCHSWSR